MSSKKVLSFIAAALWLAAAASLIYVSFYLFRHLTLYGLAAVVILFAAWLAARSSNRCGHFWSLLSIAWLLAILGTHNDVFWFFAYSDLQNNWVLLVLLMKYALGLGPVLVLSIPTLVQLSFTRQPAPSRGECFALAAAAFGVLDMTLGVGLTYWFFWFYIPEFDFG